MSPSRPRRQTISEAARAVVIDNASIRPLFPRARAAFQGLDGAAWVILPGAVVRLNDDDSVAERFDATDLHLVAAAEAPDGPRFVVTGTPERGGRRA